MKLGHGGNIFAFARQKGCDWREVTDFSASINPLGPSPSVAPAIAAAMDRIVHYPESGDFALRSAIGAKWGVAPDCLIAGNGATELIDFLAKCFRVERVYLAAPVFSEFHRVYREASIVPFDSDVWPRDGLMVVTRPANPTGTMPRVDEYLDQTSNPVLIDESFIEFTCQDSLVRRVNERPDLFILRSLTKFYAIPGLRVGVLAGSPERMAELRAKRMPWQVNVLAEAAVLASLQDEHHAQRTRQFVTEERAWLTEQLRHIPGVQTSPASANFLMVAANRPVPPLLAELEEHRILVRDCSGWPGVPFRDAFRIAVRLRAENERLMGALRGARSLR